MSFDSALYTMYVEMKINRCFQSTLFILELTLCHESNLEKSREYKLNKYKDIKSDIILVLK